MDAWCTSLFHTMGCSDDPYNNSVNIVDRLDFSYTSLTQFQELSTVKATAMERR